MSPAAREKGGRDEHRRTHEGGRWPEHSQSIRGGNGEVKATATQRRRDGDRWRENDGRKRPNEKKEPTERIQTEGHKI